MLMGLLREQENAPFLSAEEGRKGRFFKTSPAGFIGLPCNSLACGFGRPRPRIVNVLSVIQ